MSDEQERMQILNLIDQGKISAEEGLQLLQALVIEEEETEAIPAAVAGAEEAPAAEQAFSGAAEAAPSSSEQPAEQITVRTESAVPPEFTQKWRNWWQIPFWIGTAITVIGAVWMTQALQGGSLSWKFFLALIPFLLGVLIIILAWQSRHAPWLHLRIHERKAGQSTRIALSFPLPIGPTRWFIRTFGNRIPNIQGTSLDEVLLALGRGTSKENPLYIQVEEEDGEQVEIYIG